MKNEEFAIANAFFHLSLSTFHFFVVPLQPIMANMEKTNAQFEQALSECRALFEKKLHDYKASWRILRPTALTDQLFIKAKRIRSLEIKKESMVGEGIRPEFIALINYGIVGLIQLNKGFADTVDMDNLGGETLVSEGIDANYMDIINYAVFGVIKLTE